MTAFQIALYAACRVAVPGEWQLRSMTFPDGALAVIAQRRDGDGKGGSYVMVDAWNLGAEAPREGQESSWDKAIRRAVEALLRELRDERIDTVVEFLDAWRFCPVSTAANPSQDCLEDAAQQLLAALDQGEAAMRLVTRNEPLTEDALARVEIDEGKIQELIVGTDHKDFARGLKDGPFQGLPVKVDQHIAPSGWGAWV